MEGRHITILEQQDIPGGALDGLKAPEKGFVIRGGREMESTLNVYGIYIARFPL